MLLKKKIKEAIANGRVLHKLDRDAETCQQVQAELAYEKEVLSFSEKAQDWAKKTLPLILEEAFRKNPNVDRICLNWDPRTMSEYSRKYQMYFRNPWLEACIKSIRGVPGIKGFVSSFHEGRCETCYQYYVEIDESEL